MAKLSLKASPTFKAKVSIPVAGGDALEVEFTFKHRTKQQAEDFVQTFKGRSEVEIFMDIVEGWDFEEPYNAENVAELLQNHRAADRAVFRVYQEELLQHKLKN